MLVGHRTFAVLCSIACIVGAGAPGEAETDSRLTSSGVPRPPYQAIYDSLGNLARRHPGWINAIDYGMTPEGRPLRLVKLQNPALAVDGLLRPAVLITGATHGNEYLHIEDRLPQWFFSARDTSPGVARFFAKGGVLYVIPIMNPDGYDHGKRDNSHGADLNRDFDLVLPGEAKFQEAHFLEPESRAAAEVIGAEVARHGLRLAVSIDYHCCDGSLLFPWAYTDDPLPPEDLTRHERIAHLMQQDIDPAYNFGPTGQVLGYHPRGTSKDYYYAKFGALAFTFEGRYRDESRKFSKHTLFWDHVLGLIATNTAQAH